MTDARFSGGSVGLVIGHVGPEAALGGPIAFVEDGDEIVADLNNERAQLHRARRSGHPRAAQGGLGQGRWRPMAASIPTAASPTPACCTARALTAVPATRGGGLHPEPRGLGARAARAERSGFMLHNKHRPQANKSRDFGG